MTWYEPTYGYAPGEIAEELGEDVVLMDEVDPDTRPLVVYAGAFRPAVPSAMVTESEPARALATSARR